MFPIRHTILFVQSLQVSHGRSPLNFKIHHPPNFPLRRSEGHHAAAGVESAAGLSPCCIPVPWINPFSILECMTQVKSMWWTPEFLRDFRLWWLCCFFLCFPSSGQLRGDQSAHARNELGARHGSCVVKLKHIWYPMIQTLPNFKKSNPATEFNQRKVWKSILKNEQHRLACRDFL